MVKEFYFENINEERSLIINLQAKSRKSERGNITKRGVCMLPKRQQIYFTSNFWFHDFEQLCQLVYL